MPLNNSEAEEYRGADEAHVATQEARREVIEKPLSPEVMSQLQRDMHETEAPYTVLVEALNQRAPQGFEYLQAVSADELESGLRLLTREYVLITPVYSAVPLEGGGFGIEQVQGYIDIYTKSSNGIETAEAV